MIPKTPGLIIGIAQNLKSQQSKFLDDILKEFQDLKQTFPSIDDSDECQFIMAQNLD